MPTRTPHNQGARHREMLFLSTTLRPSAQHSNHSTPCLKSHFLGAKLSKSPGQLSEPELYPHLVLLFFHKKTKEREEWKRGSTTR